jgi:hypothetical protein
MIRAYRDAGATDSIDAVRPEDLGLPRSWLFERMIDRGVFIPVGDGRCFVGLDAARSYRGALRLRVVIFTLIAVVMFILFA